jgi:inosine-uridine nucleoside N-ribohydrolase
MSWRKNQLALACLLSFAIVTTAAAQKIKVIVDQDARGPGTSDQQALLVFLQSDKFEVLGITTVSGDQWVKEETQHTLRMLEIAQRTDVPVIQGAEFPLLNSKEETERWEALYGKLEYKGCWTDRFEANRSTIYDEPYHAPDIVPPMKEGAPHIQAAPGTAAEFIVKMVHKYPGEVVLWAGGPLTNFALALKLDPSVATLAKEFVMMGGGLYADKGAIDPGAIDARREFNWWFDPEAVRIVMRSATTWACFVMPASSGGTNHARSVKHSSPHDWTAAKLGMEAPKRPNLRHLQLSFLGHRRLAHDTGDGHRHHRTETGRGGERQP